MPKPKTSFQPQKAQFFDEIHTELQLNDEEIAMLQSNGFLLTDRLTFNEFRRAYAWIYWKDLPVLITTDAILHSVHQTYDEMLKALEINIFIPLLRDMLSCMKDMIQARSEKADPRLHTIYTDLLHYLLTPLQLLGRPIGGWGYHPDDKVQKPIPERVQRWETWIRAANGEMPMEKSEEGWGIRKEIPIGVEDITFFGVERKIDFSLFQARGHYDQPEELATYFAVMTWLSLLDFRFVEVDEIGKLVLHREQLAAAHILYNAHKQSGQRQNWDKLNDALTAIIGWSDNITLNGLERLINDAQANSSLHWLDMDETELLALLTENDYGQQQIRGFGQERHGKHEGDLAHNLSFSLMGQRYTIETEIMQNLIFDKLVVKGKTVERAFPSPLDVMAVLGNSRARTHLADELEKYGYEQNLDELHQWAASHSEEFWQNSFYNHWLRAILALNVDTSDDKYPTAMRSDTWADKTLHTQLGSWTQLRHDNILYVKPPFMPAAVCEYPAGYVEPYPEFYAALAEYARFGCKVIGNFTFEDPGETLEEAKERIGGGWWKKRDQLYPHEAYELSQKLTKYFGDLESIMKTLEELSKKELAGTAFSEDDNLFIRSVTVRKYVGETGYGGWTEEHWDGWYNDLLPFKDDSAALIADIHTNYNDRLGETGVLHVATGDPIAMLFVHECDGQSRIYVGPAFSYYEHFEAGLPPRRLLDYEWRGKVIYSDKYIKQNKALLEAATAMNDTLRVARLKSYIKEEQEHYDEKVASKPAPPAWINSFRIPSSEMQMLELPNAREEIRDALSSEVHHVFWELTKKIPERYQPRYGIEGLALWLKHDPEFVRSQDGVTDAIFEEIKQMMLSKGYLSED